MRFVLGSCSRPLISQKQDEGHYSGSSKYYSPPCYSGCDFPGLCQLPKKHDQVVFCPLTCTQVQAYKRILALEPVQNLIRKDDPCHCDSGLASVCSSACFSTHLTYRTRLKHCHYKYDPSDMLSYMSVLIKISNHLLLILPSAFSSCYSYAVVHAVCSTRGYTRAGMKLLKSCTFIIFMGFIARPP